MKDRFGRKIEYLRISLTDRCNLRCVYCMPEEGILKKAHTDILSLEEFGVIAEASAQLGIKKIRITGGEPLLRKGITDFIARLNEIPSLEELTLTTNGVLLSEMAKDLKAAGLKRVNISLDTLRADRYQEITRHGDIAKVMDGIQAAKAAGLLPIKLNTVLIKGFNDDEISDFIDLSVREDIIVRFIELMPIGSCAGWSREHYISAAEILKDHPELIAHEERHENSGPARYYSLEGGKGMVGFIDPVSHSFCSECNRIRLTSDGKVKPCLHSDDEIDLKEFLRRPIGENEKRALIGSALSETVFNKPKDHHFQGENAKTIKRDMYKIGG